MIIYSLTATTEQTISFASFQPQSSGQSGKWELSNVLSTLHFFLNFAVRYCKGFASLMEKWALGIIQLEKLKTYIDMVSEIVLLFI